MYQTSLTKIDDPSDQSSTHYRNYTSYSNEPNLTKSVNKLPEPSSLHRFLSEASNEKFDFSFNQSKLLINKFKKFYEALHENQSHTQKEEEKVKKKWFQFQQALNNPFKFDELIAEVRKEQRRKEERVKRDEKEKDEERGRSLMERRRRQGRGKTWYSCERRGRQMQKGRMRVCIKQIKSILSHGEKFIKSDSLNS